MTLLDVQRRFHEIGRIRAGAKTAKGAPTKLDTWRLTSPSRDALLAAAERYGGTVRPWEGQYELVTKADRLDVMLPPRAAGTRAYSLAYELWSGGGCLRRCDGSSATVAGDKGALVETACLCDPDDRECSPTLRVPFFLPDLPGLGTWRLDSGGYNAAAELPGMLDLLTAMVDAGKAVRATLRLEQRVAKRGGQTRRFAVPVLDLPYSLSELAGPRLPQLTGATESGRSEATESSASAVGSTQATPAPAPSPEDAPLAGEELARWLAGTHAAFRERTDAADLHAALRDLAAATIELGDRSLNDLTRTEWRTLAQAIRALPVIEHRTNAGGSGPQVSDPPEASAAHAEPPAPAPAAAAPPPGGGSPASTSPPDDVLRARYAWGRESLGFADDDAFDEAVIAMTGLSVMDLDADNWKVTATALRASHAAAPPKPGTQAYRDLPDGLARASARAHWDAVAAAEARTSAEESLAAARTGG